MLQNLERRELHTIYIQEEKNHAIQLQLNVINVHGIRGRETQIILDSRAYSTSRRLGSRAIYRVLAAVSKALCSQQALADAHLRTARAGCHGIRTTSDQTDSHLSAGRNVAGGGYAHWPKLFTFDT